MEVLGHKRIFVDMDDVIAGFNDHYLTNFHKDLRISGLVTDEELWSNVNDYPGDFFYDLPIMDGALEGVNWIKSQGYEVVYLTACPADNYENVANQKHDWIRLKFQDEQSLVVPVVGGKNKARLLQFQGDILIDDFTKNIVAWNNAGGRGIVHTDWPSTLEKLRQML